MEVGQCPNWGSSVKEKKVRKANLKPCENGNAVHKLGTGLLLQKGIILAIR
jgi:hypothetical protein